MDREKASAHDRQRRVLYLGCVLAVVALGLGSRRYGTYLPAFVGEYAGDTLWALMVFLGWAFVRPASPTGRLAVFALVTSYVVEFSQLYQAPWINAIRSTTVGHLVLGSTFSWLDICAYTVGVAVGVCLDVSLNGTVRLDASTRLTFRSKGTTQKGAAP